MKQNKRTPDSVRNQNRGCLGVGANSSGNHQNNQGLNLIAQHLGKCAACETPKNHTAEWLMGVYHDEPYACLYLLCPVCMRDTKQMKKAWLTVETTVRDLQEQRSAQ